MSKLAEMFSLKTAVQRLTALSVNVAQAASNDIAELDKKKPESVKLKRKPFSVSSFLCSQILLEIAELCGIVQSEFGFSSEITLEFLHPMGEEIL